MSRRNKTTPLPRAPRQPVRPSPDLEPAPAFPAELDVRAGLAAGDVCDDETWARWLDSHDGADREAQLDADLARPLSAATRAEMALASASRSFRAAARRTVAALTPGAFRPAAAR